MYQTHLLPYCCSNKRWRPPRVGTKVGADLVERATPEKVLREGTLILVFVFALCFPLCVPPGFCLGSGELSPYLMGGPFLGPLLSACPGF